MASAARKFSAPRVLSGTVYVTRQVHFNAAHRLHNPAKSAAWNRTTFGPCNNAKWHGHNYELEVTVAGEPDPDTGYVIDLGALKTILEERILRDCDHRNLNEEVKWLRGIIPSAENLAIAFWTRIAPVLPSGRLHRVRLLETPRNFVDYYGPDGGPR
ncbi:6-pyruvoyl trahydropterin synthase family protein [Synoicihabitans lomoniglobus]|uniref:6-carboxy-5,6,7,8-tetrahydropterin synthase n=1 Tax=Synoicihabitans lomoniglobus TaxID=2909285 RepID=A0AAE9ZWH0_9BACT|nr:6-carboxytetrahydropterin synthase [Opitutaceae bacterium LMO-M01]WED65536.1 6-carboxytetrahydropterin synthase [Opitutaceae bacterium LMO-M01]